MFGICCTAKTYSVLLVCVSLSLSLCLSFIRSLVFFALSRFPTSAVLLSLSLSLYVRLSLSLSLLLALWLPCLWLFSFFSFFSLSRTPGFVSHLLKRWCVSRVSDGCQRFTKVTIATFSICCRSLFVTATSRNDTCLLIEPVRSQCISTSLWCSSLSPLLFSARYRQRCQPRSLFQLVQSSPPLSVSAFTFSFHSAPRPHKPFSRHICT